MTGTADGLWIHSQVIGKEMMFVDVEGDRHISPSSMEVGRSRLLVVQRRPLDDVDA